MTGFEKMMAIPELSRLHRCALSLAVALLSSSQGAMAASHASTHAAAPAPADLSQCDAEHKLPTELSLDAGSQQPVSLPAAITRVAIGEPTTADVAVIDTHTLLLQAKKTGQTTLFVWTKCSKDPSRMMITVPAPPPPPEEPTAGQKLARASVPEGVAEALPSQVQVDIRFVELSRSRLLDLGVRMAGGNGKNTIGGSQNTSAVTSTTSTLSPAPATEFNFPVVSNALNFVWGASGGKFAAALNLLEQNGYAYTLSQPTLVAMSGQTASFLAGGEIPIPVPQVGTGTNTITIQYKEYGVRLSVTPTVLSSNQVILKVAPEVSELDYTNALTILGSAVPALSVRRSDTTISLADGESFVISGLVSRSMSDNASQVPGLGNIPVLGAFFRSKTFKSEDKELLMVVTPHLVRPLAVNAKLPPLPGANLRDYSPGAGEYFLKSQTTPYPVTPIGFTR